MPRQHAPVDPALLSQQSVSAVSTVSGLAIEHLFACCIASPGLLRDAVRMLHVHHFDMTERALAVTWQLISEAASNSWLVTYDYLCTQLSLKLQMDRGVLPPNKLDEVLQADDSGLFWALTHPASPITEQSTGYARNILQLLLQERTVARPLARIASMSLGDGRVVDMNPMLDAVALQRDRLVSLDAMPTVSSVVVRGTPTKRALEYRSTGIRFVDESIGGDSVGDVSGLLGPMGGGKTTLAIHMAVSTARYAFAEAIRTSSRPPLVVYVTYEQAATKLRPMSWSVAFQIPRRKLQSLGDDWSRLTTPDCLEDYERALVGVSADGAPYPVTPLSETERWDAESVWLGRCFTFLDMSGSDEHPTAGNGGVPELLSYLERLQQDRQQPLRAVYIDYAGLLISGVANSQNISDERDRRNMLRELGMQLRRQIAQRFNCTVWLLHQMSGAATKVSPTRVLTHGDAADCKSFAENMAVCGCLGNEDKSTGCRLLNWSKTRHTDGATALPSTLRINNLFAMMEDVTRNYRADPARGVFMTAADAQRVDTTAAVVRPRASRGSVGSAAGPEGFDSSNV